MLNGVSDAPVGVSNLGTTRRVGLVLGGGGAVGAAYHAGALAALEHDLGWDPRRADVIVGTSAGALVGALLRLGLPSSDLAAIAVGAPVRHANRALVERLVNRPAFPPLTVRALARRPRRLNPRTLSGVAKLWSRRGIAAFPSLSMFLPEGDEALMPHLGFIDDVLDAPWPRDPLLLCAVRRRNSRRTVFGPGAKHAPLAAAITASCAVPGYFADVVIDGETYVDGGVISATNADVLARHDIDVAIVISPMTGASGGPSFDRSIRRFCRRTLDHEIRALARNGIPTVVIEPGPEVTRHLSLNFMSETASLEIVRQAFLDTGKQILANGLLHGLSTRTPPRFGKPFARKNFRTPQ
jgi:NTE family protein